GYEVARSGDLFSGQVCKRVGDTVTQRVAGVLVMSERQVELRPHRVEEDAAIEQAEHHSPGPGLVAPGGRAVVVDLSGGEDDLGERPVADDLGGLVAAVEDAAQAGAQIAAEMAQSLVSAGLAEYGQSRPGRGCRDRVSAQGGGHPDVVVAAD